MASSTPTLSRPPKLDFSGLGRRGSLFSSPRLPRPARSPVTTPKPPANSDGLFGAAVGTSQRAGQTQGNEDTSFTPTQTTSSPIPKAPARVGGLVGPQHTVDSAGHQGTNPAPNPGMSRSGFRGGPVYANPSPNAPAASAWGGPPAGAPDPGTPDTSAAPDSSFPIPLVPADELAKQEAQGTYDDTVSGLRYGMGQAAFNYGDPALMGQWGITSTVNPNSVLALAALRAQQQNQGNTNAMGRAGTTSSSINLDNIGRIGATQQRSDLAGYQRYKNALAKFNAAMIAADKARLHTINTANLDERNTAIANLPNASQATGGEQGSTNQGAHSGKPSVGNSAADRSKSSLPKPSRPSSVTAPRVKSSKTQKTSTSVRVPGTKSVTSVGSGRRRR